MSKYTTELRWIVEHYANNPSLNIYQQIDVALPKIFNFSYPIFDETYRTTLERKIVMHYLTREIGAETVGLWKLFLNERLNLIMPYYNDLYLTVREKFNILTDVDITEVHSGSRNENGNFQGTVNGTASDSGSSKSTSLLSELPQATLNNLDYGTTSTQNDADSSNTTTTESKNNNTNKVDTTDNYTNTRTGLTGGRTRAELMRQYEASLFNIDMRVINELNNLFMLIY